MKLDTVGAHDLCCSGLLCRQYLVLYPGSVPVRLRTGGVADEAAIGWGLGVLADGGSEVFLLSAPGASGPACPAGWALLAARGVESVGWFVSADTGLAAEVSGVFPGASVLPSLQALLAAHSAGVRPRLWAPAEAALLEVCSALTLPAAQRALARAALTPWAVTHPAQLAQWQEALAQLGPFYAPPARQRRVLRWADGAAWALHRALAQALGRHGPFGSRDEAEALVAAVLLRGLRRQGPGPELGSLGPVPVWPGFTAGAGRSRMALPRL